MLMYIALVITWIGLVSGQGGLVRDNFTCSLLSSTSSPNAPPLPSIPNQFYTNVEANFVDMKTTLDITEYYDYPGNRGVIKITQQGIPATVIYSYETNELITIVDMSSDGKNVDMRQCDIMPLNKSESTIIQVFGYKTPNGTAHIYSIADVMKFAGTNQTEIYEGRTNVRGITVDHWYSCGYWTDERSIVQVDWYFSVSDGIYWHSPLNMPVPVRAHVFARIYNEEGGFRDIEHIYDFTQFRLGLPPGRAAVQIFQVPPGTICVDKVKTKPLPELSMLPLYFSFGAEIINPVRNSLAHANVWYDNIYNLARFETSFADLDTNPQAAESYGSSIIIQDFNTGVQYHIDKTQDSCKLSPIDPEMSIDIRPTDYGMLRMAVAAELFKLNQTQYTYQGKRGCRMAECDVWISLRDDFPPGTTTHDQTTFEWEFLSDRYIQLNAIIPFRLIINQLDKFGTELKPELNQIINFFNFDSEDEPSVWGYDIHLCYTSASVQKHVRFTLPGIDSSGRPVGMSYRDLKFNIFNTIMGIIDVSPIRIYNIEIELQSQYERMLVTFSLLDIAPSIGKIVNPLPELSLDDAFKTLNNSINSGNFVVFVSENPEDPQSVTAQPNSLIEVVRVKIPCNKTEIVTPVKPTTQAPTLSTTTPKSDLPTTTPKSDLPTTTYTPKPQSDLPTTTSKLITLTAKAGPEPPRGGTGCPNINQVSEQDSSQLSTGVIVGIAVGSALGGALIGIIIFYVVYAKIRNSSDSASFPMARFK